MKKLEHKISRLVKDAEDAVAYAEAAPYPDPSEVDMHVFTDVLHATWIGA